MFNSVLYLQEGEISRMSSSDSLQNPKGQLAGTNPPVATLIHTGSDERERLRPSRTKRLEMRSGGTKGKSCRMEVEKMELK